MNMVRMTVVTLTVLLGSAVVLDRAWAVSNPRGMLFRAVGIFQGEVEEGKCKVPTATQAISDSTNSICRDAMEIAGEEETLVYPTQMFPELQAFGNFCGGFLALQNNMINQAVNVYRVRVRYKILGNGFPVLCRDQRKFNLWIGSRVDPVDSENPSPFGAPNITLTQLLPIYSAQMLNCLRDPLRGNVEAPVTVVAKIKALGFLDEGDEIESNPVYYTLTLLPNGSTPGAASRGVPPVGVSARCAEPVQ